jgi:ketosteroid isomerase-like protein
MNAEREADIALVERVARTTAAEGPAGVLEFLEEVYHPDFEWHPGIVGLSRIAYTGRDEYREYLKQVQATSRKVELTDWAVRAAGEGHVLLTGNLRYESRDQDHLEFDAEYAVLYRIEDGRLRTGRSFQSIEAAEEAAMELSDAQA